MSELKINLREAINFYRENLGNFIIYSLVPLLMGLAIIFFYKPLTYTDQKIYTFNILIEDPVLIENINEDYFFSARNLKETISRSNLSEEISLDADFINSFKIVSGHSDLNTLTDFYLESDLEALTQSLYYKPAEIDQFLNNLISKGNRFRAITYDKKNLEVGAAQIKVMMANLIDVINESISRDYDAGNINLKVIQNIDISSPLSSIDVNQINNRLLLIREYIDILSNQYSSFAPDINLQILLSNLDTNEELFNYIIQESEFHKSIMKKQINLDVEALDKRILKLEDKLNYLQGDKPTDKQLSSNSSNDVGSLNADASFIDRIISLSSLASSQEKQFLYINEISALEIKKISLESRLSNLELQSSFELSFDEAKTYLFNSLNDTSEQINEYIQIVKDTKKTSLIVPLSLNSPSGYIDNIIMPIIMILFGSLFFSFAILTIKFGLK